MATDSPKVPLTNKPGVTNWVERTHALEPHSSNWIYRCAEHLKGKGMDEGQAIPIAVNAAKKLCSTGDLNWPGLQHANFGSRAQACAAVAKWNAARAQAHADLSADRVIFRLVDLTKVRISKDAIDLATVTAEEGRTLVKRGKAMPNASGDPSFPIRNRDDLSNAIMAVGRARPATDDQRAKVRRYIMAQAKKLNATDLIPDSWNADGSVNLTADAQAIIDLAGSNPFGPGSQMVGPSGQFTGLGQKRKKQPTQASTHQAAIDAAVAHLKKHPAFKNASDKQLRQAANRTVARQSLRHAIGITDVRKVDAKQAAVLREVNLLPGGKTDKAGKLSGQQRIKARQALGVKSLATASPKQIAALRKAGLIAGGTKQQRAGAKGFDESQHPRAAAGSSAGGQFTKK